MNEMEKASGGGVITGFGSYWMPNPRQRNGETGNEQNNE